VPGLIVTFDYLWEPHAGLDVALSGSALDPNSAAWLDITAVLGMTPSTVQEGRLAWANLSNLIDDAGIASDVYIRFRNSADGSGSYWQSGIDNLNVTVTPELGTLWLLALGGVGTLAFLRRRRS
jgi:MYXO-CTERM domain-containing protein